MPDYIQVTVTETAITSVVTVDAGLLPSGGATGQVLTKLSSADGHVAWTDSGSGGLSVVPFADVATMLAVSSTTWRICRILSTYGMPLITYWNCVPKSEGTLVPNGNSVLATDDGLAYAVKMSSIVV